MNYYEINEIIKNLQGQLQDLKPRLELARGKEAWVMQEDQDSEIVEEASKEAFNKFLRIIESAQKNAHRLIDIIPNPLIENILGNLWSLDQPLSAVCFMDNNTGQASLQEGYIEDYINCKKDALATLRQLSQELSEISPPLVIWQNIISEIRSIGSQSATHKYSKIEGPPGPYNKIREEIAGLLNDIESAQKICIQVSENATTALVKLHHRVSDTKDLVNRNFCKGETPPQKLKSIQDDLSQAFKKIEMEYRDLLEEFAVEFEVANIKLATSAEAEQSLTPKPEVAKQEDKSDGDKKTTGNISGMRWSEAKKKAEALVDEKGFLGHKKLYEAIGCSDNTLRKAIVSSPKLQEAKEQYKSTSKTLKAVGLTDKVVATYEDSSGPKLSDTEVDESLAELLAETEKKNPAMLEPTKERLEKMDSDAKQRLAEAYNKSQTNISRDGAETPLPKRHKKV